MRALLRLLSPLLALALAAAGALLTVETVWALARPDADPLVAPWPQWRTSLEGYAWSDTPVLIAASALGVIGLLLLILARSARRHDVRMADPADDVTVVTTPRSLARLVGHRVRDEDGVTSASVVASSRLVRVRAVSRIQGEDALRPTLTRTVDDLVTSLPLARRPRVRVVVDSPKDNR